jgi:hypothetical protein
LSQELNTENGIQVIISSHQLKDQLIEKEPNVTLMADQEIEFAIDFSQSNADVKRF